MDIMDQVGTKLRKAELYRITSPYFIAGIEVNGQTIIKAAPIVKYALGMTKDKFFSYCKARHWDVERL